MEIIQSVWDILVELAPWLLFGAAIAGVLHVLLPKNFIKQQLGKPGLRSVIKAALIGVPLPLCSCSVIPTGLALKKDGAGTGAALSFIISTPQTGVDSIAVTAAFLGWPFALFKVAAAFITGIIGGLLAEEKKSEGELSDTQPDVQGQQSSCCGSDDSKSRIGIVGLIQSAGHFAVWELLHSIWRWLLIGVVLSACISVYLPDIMPSGDSNLILTMLIVLAISIPLYVCATASVPIAASLVVAGFPMGAALVFLMAGPATNIATIGAVGKVLGKRALIVYLSVVIVASMGLGIVYDMFIDGAFTSAISSHQHGNHGIISEISAVVLLLICAFFAIRDIQNRLQRGKAGEKMKSCCSSETTPAETPVKSCCAPVVDEEPRKPCCGG